MGGEQGVRPDERLLLAERKLRDIREAELNTARKTRKRLRVTTVLWWAQLPLLGWFLGGGSTTITILASGFVVSALAYVWAERRLARTILDAEEELGSGVGGLRGQAELLGPPTEPPPTALDQDH